MTPLPVEIFTMFPFVERQRMFTVLSCECVYVVLKTPKSSDVETEEFGIKSICGTGRFLSDGSVVGEVVFGGATSCAALGVWVGISFAFIVVVATLFFCLGEVVFFVVVEFVF